MNETIKSILSRRSIKEYKPEQIKAEELEMILLAGRYAPSGMNRQPWLFVVIQNKDVLLKINEILQRNRPKNMPAPPPGQKRPNPLETAPTLIVVFGQDDMFTTIYDCTLAMGNMMIAATSLGIGSNWVHAVVKDLFTSEEGKALKKEWGVPDEYIPYAAAVFGYKAAEPIQRSPRKDGVVKIIN
ncbi:nitroreductase family protein [Calorimonas adulescens]|jgi:Nitroreductase family.|uniref:Nitroreductase family protein n=1 Tax=Calorimonas adulescens TaxID=2606906 RepID=A0A5D8QDP0_9THEO|nr:nitroreductase family protein [Calorimonas adulescens]TZE82621.1 nitroreductase family protein [Calorimonas adulescens]